MKKVAIQGYKGCFHEQAARLFYGEIEPLECNTFEDLYKALDAGEADAAVMAIENTVSGGLLHNFELLRTQGKRGFLPHTDRSAHVRSIGGKDNAQEHVVPRRFELLHIPFTQHRPVQDGDGFVEMRTNGGHTGGGNERAARLQKRDKRKTDVGLRSENFVVETINLYICIIENNIPLFK